MKKILIGISGVLILGVVLVLFVNAQTSPQEVKKPAAVMSEDCGKCPSAAAAACGTMKESKTTEVAKCDPAKCKEMGCDPAKCKEGKCDPATCKGMTAEAKAAAPSCCAAAPKK